jgi:hypothetical protein
VVTRDSDYCGSLLYPPETLRQYYGKDGDRQIAHFQESLRKANAYLCVNPPDSIAPRMSRQSGLRGALQYYADEMFLTLYAFVSLDLAGDAGRLSERQGLYSALLGRAFKGDAPSVADPKLKLERPIPASKAYLRELERRYQDECATCHPVWYRRRLGSGNAALEGATHTDALLSLYGDFTKASGRFAMFEAKFLSDISGHTTYAPDRDQLTRNLDAGLDYVQFDLDRFWYVFVTPECFKTRPESRFYGYKLREFMDPASGPERLKAALPHLAREHAVDFEKLSRHIGWVTWEDICEVVWSCPGFDDPDYPRSALERFFRDRCVWPGQSSCLSGGEL